MTGARGVLEPGLDPAWLAGEAERDPVAHAYALWDLRTAPDRTRFVALRRGPGVVAYLLLWLGTPSRPVVHWVGPDDDGRELAEGLPSPPFVGVVPEPAVPWVQERFPELRAFPLLVMERLASGRLPRSRHASRLKRLGPPDTPSMRRLAEEYPELVTTMYATLDPTRTPVWGVVEGERLVGIARASVTLPNVWIVGGVFTVPDARRRGIGRAVTTAVTRSAHRAGARAGLFVRADNAPAIRLYGSLGYRVAARRAWVEAPAPPTGVG